MKPSPVVVWHYKYVWKLEISKNIYKGKHIHHIQTKAFKLAEMIRPPLIIKSVYSFTHLDIN